MKVLMLASTNLSDGFLNYISKLGPEKIPVNSTGTEDILFTAIRTCYSKSTPTEVIPEDYEKYFGTEDEPDKTKFKRLFDRIFNSGHWSTLEHVNFTFAVEGVSRSLLAQLTRHRHISFSVQSQRYVKFDGGFDYVIPNKVKEKGTYAIASYVATLQAIEDGYEELRELGLPAEDARYLLPNAAHTNMVITLNLRTLFELYAKRQRNKGAQWEIAEMVEGLRREVVAEEPWLDEYFERTKEVI